MNRSTIAKSVFILAALGFATFRVSSYVQSNLRFWQRDAEERARDRDRTAYANQIALIEDSLRQSGVRIALPCKALDGFAFYLDSIDVTDENLTEIQLAFQRLREIAPGVHTEIKLGKGIDSRALPILATVNRLSILETSDAVLSADDLAELQQYHPNCVVVEHRSGYTYN